MSDQTLLITAHTLASRQWSHAFAGFTSGHDPRSSDNALLALLHGGLEHAARHAWQNAGRRLIDKTYVDILWHVQALTTIRTCRAEAVAAALDGFIGDRIRPHWLRLATMEASERQTLAASWVESMAQNCFGSLHSEAAASRMLFFLCPTLPLFNLSTGHLLALQQLGYVAESDDYASYAAAAALAYRDHFARLRGLHLPDPAFGDTQQRQLVQQVLVGTDWWQRRVFDQLLRARAQQAGISEAAFACDGAGQLTDIASSDASS